MYKEPDISLLYKSKVTEAFYTSIGLQQCEILSKIFFSILINELSSLSADTSNENNEKPKLEDTNISSFFFADDIATFTLLQKKPYRTKLMKNTDTIGAWD